MSEILRLKCIKFDFGWGSAPDPAGGAYIRRTNQRPTLCVTVGIRVVPDASISWSVDDACFQPRLKDGVIDDDNGDDDEVWDW